MSNIAKRNSGLPYESTNFKKVHIIDVWRVSHKFQSVLVLTIIRQDTLKLILKINII